MKNSYIAVTIEENGKYYSYVVKVTPSDNLLSKLKIAGIVSATICNTKTHAGNLVGFWNACYKGNGTYLYDNPSF